MKYLITLLWMLMGCARPTVVVPDSISVYYNGYFDIVGWVKESPGTIRFASISQPNVVAECYMTHGMGPWLINIDPTAWMGEDDEMRREVIFHELTHCIFFAQHSDDPNSYMFWAPHELPEAVLDQQVKDLENNYN